MVAPWISSFHMTHTHIYIFRTLYGHVTETNADNDTVGFAQKQDMNSDP
jgi:hypothetical protein